VIKSILLKMRVSLVDKVTEILSQKKKLLTEVYFDLQVHFEEKYGKDALKRSPNCSISSLPVRAKPYLKTLFRTLFLQGYLLSLWTVIWHGSSLRKNIRSLSSNKKAKCLMSNGTSPTSSLQVQTLNTLVNPQKTTSFP